MPLINQRTSLPEVANATELLQELSSTLAQQTWRWHRPQRLCGDQVDRIVAAAGSWGWDGRTFG